MSKRRLIFALLAIFMGLAVLPCDTRAQQQKSAMSPTGFVIGEPVTHPMRLPVLTRDQLVTRGHAEDKAEIAELFQTYMFYHDTHNGEGVASLFTEDGVLEHLWNNGGRTVEPNAGPNGKGCFRDPNCAPPGRRAAMRHVRNTPTDVPGQTSSERPRPSFPTPA
jgi:hypothetical protein